MGFAAKIILDSVNPAGKRLTTMEVTYPRIVHSELMTHRQFSRNAASSRAIPVKKMIERVESDPFVPIVWGTNQKGMQAAESLRGVDAVVAEAEWLKAADDAVRHAKRLTGDPLNLNVHKQLANRLLEPFSWITVIVTATEWNNFFAQRCHPDAEPHLHKIADMMRDCYFGSRPSLVEWGEWHLPYLTDEDDFMGQAWHPIQVSVARCARVSFLNHDGKRDISADIGLYQRLITGGANGHWSPFEHVAQADAYTNPQQIGNFASGWFQFRKMFQQEYLRDYKYERNEVVSDG